MQEARLEDTPAGRVPAGAGWWILNLGEIAWEAVEGNGTFCVFEAPSAPSPLLGIGDGASVAAPTADPREAYAATAPIVPARSPWPLPAM